VFSKLLAYPHLFPCIMQVLYACALVRYSADRDWTRVLYWAGALLINATVTFGKMR
jgi:hypothetical protein